MHASLDLKRQGEYGEARFLVASYELGLPTSKPWGESLPYDFVLDNGHRLLRIQVKSVGYRRKIPYIITLRNPRRFEWRPRARWAQVGAYHISMRHGRPKRGYDRSQIDFVAALIVPENVWYIIPVRAVEGRVSIAIFPHNPKSKGRFERYKDAWHLLRR